MSYPKHLPQILDAKELAQQYRLPSVMIIFCTEEGQIGGASYGKDRTTCQKTSKVMDIFINQVMDGEIDSPIMI